MSINLHSVFGVVTTRTSCTHVGDPASPNSFASPISPARTTRIGLLSASSDAPGLTFTGCATRSAQVMTAGISASTSSNQRASVDFQFSRAGDLRNADQLRDFGTDLPRLRVERVLAEHDQIEMFARQPRRERTRCRERVSAGESTIFKVHSVIHSHRERIDQRAARLRRSHRDDCGLGAVPIFQLDRERDRAQVERADHIGPVALDRLRGSVEVGFLDQRYLLDANGNLEHCDIPRPDEAS